MNYKDTDRLRVKIHPYVDSFCIPNWENPKSPILLGDGGQDYEVTIIGRSLKDIEGCVEEDPQAWERAKAKFEKQKERFRKRAESDNDVKGNAAALEEVMFVWGLQHSAARTFFEDEGRGRRELKSLEILENLGPSPDNYKAKAEDDRELNELLKEKLRRELMGDAPTQSTKTKVAKSV